MKPKESSNATIYLRNNNVLVNPDSGNCVTCGASTVRYNTVTSEFKCLYCIDDELAEFSRLICIPQAHLTN